MTLNDEVRAPEACTLPTPERLTARETECCSRSSVELEVEVPQAHAAVLDALAKRAAAGITT